MTTAAAAPPSGSLDECTGAASPIYYKKDTTEPTPDATDLNNNHTGPDTILLSDVQPETVVKDLLPEQDQTTVLQQPKRLHVSNIPFRFRDPDLRAMFGVTNSMLSFNSYTKYNNLFIYNLAIWRDTGRGDYIQRTRLKGILLFCF